MLIFVTGGREVGGIGGRKTPCVFWEMCSCAVSNAASMRRLPPPAVSGTGWGCLFREEGGMWQPTPMPVDVEKNVSGVEGLLCIDGEGFPRRRVCVGESWKREGRVDGLEEERV